MCREHFFVVRKLSPSRQYKNYECQQSFFFSPLSPPFSFLSRVVSRLMGVQKTRFRCRSGQNGQIFRSNLSKIQVDIVSNCCQMAKNDRILADERPLEHFLAILAHFMPIIIVSNCCQMAKNDRILADERPLEHFLAILAHFMPIYTRIFENGTAGLRCPSGVSRALFCRSETISKVGNIKIMSASSPFSSPLSPLPSLFSPVWF